MSDDETKNNVIPLFGSRGAIPQDRAPDEAFQAAADFATTIYFLGLTQVGFLIQMHNGQQFRVAMFPNPDYVDLNPTDPNRPA